MSDSIPLRSQIRRNRFTSGVVYLSILILSAAAGLGLTYSLQPPKPQKPPLIYDLMLFKSSGQMTDFSDHVAMMDSISDRQRILSLRMHGRQVNQDAVVLNAMLRLQPKLFTLSNSTAYLLTASKSQLDVEGKELGNKIVTELGFRHDGKWTKHHFVSDENQLQLLVLDQGSSSNRQVTYALIRVKRISARLKTPRVFILPN